MRSAKLILFVLSVLGVGGIAPRSTAPAHAQLGVKVERTVIAASTVLDGNGHVLHNVRIVIEGTKIVAIDPKPGIADYDLRGLTVLPGWIDAHVHLTWFFGKDGKFAGPDAPANEVAHGAAANAWLTLMAGFTTSSVGSSRLALREAIDKNITRPRVLTSLEPLMAVAQRLERRMIAPLCAGRSGRRDLIKIMASGSMRSGTMTLAPEQPSAACDEAKGRACTPSSMLTEMRSGPIVARCTEVDMGWERRTRI